MNGIDQIIKEILNTAPLWETGVWEALQNRSYKEVEIRLRDFLTEEFEGGEWEEIYWKGILGGIPSFRGKLDEEAWRQYALPTIGRAVIQAASPEELSGIYHSLFPGEWIKQFHWFIINAIPGETPEQKLDWLRANKPSLTNFYSANLAGLRISPEEHGILSIDGLAKFKKLTPELRESILSARAAGAVMKLAEDNHIPQDKIPVISELIGSVLLGNVHPEDLAKQLQEKLHFQNQLANELAAEINKKILAPIIEDIKSLYHWGVPEKPKEKIPSSPPPERTPPPIPKEAELLKPGFRKETVSQEPFIIHQEQEITPVVGKTPPPLTRPSFFKETSTSHLREEAVKARLELGELPEEKKEELRVGKTEPPAMRVVNYSGLRTPIDPFAPVPEEPKEEEQPPVHPKNVINLKDLPR